MTFHAWGQAFQREVYIDFPRRRHSIVKKGSLESSRATFTLDEALKLRHQLDVAIGEAAGQQRMDLTHDEQGECRLCETPRWPDG